MRNHARTGIGFALAAAFAMGGCASTRPNAANPQTAPLSRGKVSLPSSLTTTQLSHMNRVVPFTGDGKAVGAFTVQQYVGQIQYVYAYGWVYEYQWNGYTWVLISEWPSYDYGTYSYNPFYSSYFFYPFAYSYGFDGQEQEGEGTQGAEGGPHGAGGEGGEHANH